MVGGKQLPAAMDRAPRRFQQKQTFLGLDRVHASARFVFHKGAMVRFGSIPAKRQFESVLASEFAVAAP
jgi:hypothetical protein